MLYCMNSVDTIRCRRAVALFVVGEFVTIQAVSL